MNDSSGSFVSTDDFRFLTPEKVKERIKHLKYEGDPDLLPVGSHESQFLVTLFYRLSTKINEEVSFNCKISNNFDANREKSPFWNVKFVLRIILPGMHYVGLVYKKKRKLKCFLVN